MLNYIWVCKNFEYPQPCILLPTSRYYLRKFKFGDKVYFHRKTGSAINKGTIENRAGWLVKKGKAFSMFDHIDLTEKLKLFLIDKVRNGEDI